MKNLLFILVCVLYTLNLSAQEQKIDVNKSMSPTASTATEDYNLDIEPTGRLPRLVRVTGKVTDVHDGDTIKMIDAGKQQYRCRFNGIDAPELKQDFGNRSKQSLSDQVFGKTITIEYDKIDKYGRFVCKILVDGADVNLEQIRRGMAWHYKKYQDEQTPEDRTLYAAAETEARARKLGLWEQSNATPPWDWRRGVNNPNLAGVPAGAIIGNTNSLIYHTPGCSTYAKVAPQNRIVFQNEKDAIAKGYKLSGACESTLPVEERPKKETVKKVYQTGTRGGCYYLNAAGKKVYVDKSNCQ